MTPPLPYRFERLTPQEVVQGNRIFQKDPGLSFQLGDHAYALKIEPNNAQTQPADSYKAVVRMDERICFELFPEEKLLAMTLAKVASVEDFNSMPSEIRAIALEAALENLLERIEHFSGAKATIETVDSALEPRPSKACLGFTLTRTSDGTQSCGSIETDEVGLEWLTARLGRLPGSRFRQFNHLPLFGRIVVGSLDLSVAELEDLAPLDMLLCESAGTWENRDIRIHYGENLTIIGRLHPPDQVFIHNLITQNGKRSSMPEAEPATTAQPQEILSDIPITLVFEIGQTQMAMGELAQLQPGYTFQLSEPLDISQPVTIRANGVAVGKGAIVQIGDTLGVRIQSFSADNSMTVEQQTTI